MDAITGYVLYDGEKFYEWGIRAKLIDVLGISERLADVYTVYNGNRMEFVFSTAPVGSPYWDAKGYEDVLRKDTQFVAEHLTIR